MLEEKFIKSTDISPSSFHLLQSLFAALCYHREYLEEVLSPRNKLRASPLFNTCFVFEHRDQAVTAFPWNATSRTPQFSGIAPHTMILVEMERLKKDMAKQAEMISEKLKQELDNRKVGGTEHIASEILQEVSEFVFCFKHHLY